jgi:hypothetical protein
LAGLTAIGAACFLLAAWVTTAPNVPILRGVVPSDSSDRPRGLPPIQQPVDANPPKTQRSTGHGLSLELTILLYAVLLLLLLAVSVLIVRKVVITRRLRRERVGAAAAEAIDDGWELAVSDDLARSATRGLTALAQGEPRNAIVRCWIELEDAVERVGRARDPALTSEEFTAEVLQRYAIGRVEIEMLGALYREARFSEHPMSESHRDSAIRALTTLRDELRRSQESEQVPAATEPGR